MESEEQQEMTLVGHLGELRSCVVRCAVAGLVGLVAAYALYDPWIFNLLRGPLDALAGRTENPFVFDNPLTRLLASEEVRNLELDLHAIGFQL